MSSVAVLLDIPSQPVNKKSKITVVLSIQSDHFGFDSLNMALTFDPAVLKLHAVKPNNCSLSAPTVTFSSGVVPINISSISGNPGINHCADIRFTVIGNPGMSTEVSLDLLNIRFTDGKSSGGVTGKARVIVTPNPLQHTVLSLPDAIIGHYYRYQFTVEGGVPPYKWVGLRIPDYFNLYSSGILTGTPRSTGMLNFEVELSDSNNPSETISDAFTLKITTESMSMPENKLEDCKLGQIYYSQLSVWGGIPPYKWNIKSGRLPQRIELSESGMLSGPCIEVGNFNVSVAVDDNSGSHCESDIVLNAHALFNQIRCGKISEAQSMIALPNLVYQPYDITIDVEFEFGLMANHDLGLASTISIDDKVIFNNILGSGKKAIPNCILPGGPRIIKISIDSKEVDRGYLKFKEIKIAPGNNHKNSKANPVKLTFIELDKRTNAVISDSKKVTPGEELLVEVALPGSSDDILVARKDGLEILTNNHGKIVPAKAFNINGISSLKCVIKGGTGKHLFITKMQDNKVIGLIRQEEDGDLSYTSLNVGQEFSGFAPLFDSRNGIFKVAIGTKEGIEIIDIENGSKVGPFAAYGAAGSDEILDICTLDLAKGGIDLIAANKYGNNIAFLSGDDFVSANVKSTAIDIGQPVKVDAKRMGQQGNIYIAAACKTKNTVIIFNIDKNNVINRLQEVKVGASPSDVVMTDFYGEGNPTVLTADRISNTVSVTTLNMKDDSTADIYFGPEKTSSITVAREADGRLRVFTLGLEDGEIVSWLSYGYCPMCQVSPSRIDKTQLNKGQAWIFKKGLTIGNSGIVDLTIYDIKVKGTTWPSRSPHFLFSDTPDFPTKLSPDKSVSLDFIFPGNTAGKYGCSIEITTNDPLYPTINIPVSIRVDNVEVPIRPYQTELFFGYVLQGTRDVYRTWSVLNPYKREIFIEKLWIVGKNSDVFKLSPQTFPLKFTDWDLRIRIDADTNRCGLYEAAVIAEIKTNNERFMISSTLLMPVHTYYPTIRLAYFEQFGTVNFGDYRVEGILVRNDGFADLIISQATLSGSDADQFEVASPLPYKAQPGSFSRDFKVKYKPTRYKRSQAKLTFSTNDPNNLQASTDLIGSCYSSNIALIPQLLEFGCHISDFDQYKPIRTATFYNWGPVSADISIRNIVGNFELVDNIFPITKMNGAVDFNVVPKNTGNKGIENGYIEFSTNDPNKPIIKLNLKAYWSD